MNNNIRYFNLLLKQMVYFTDDPLHTTQTHTYWFHCNNWNTSLTSYYHIIWFTHVCKFYNIKSKLFIKKLNYFQNYALSNRFTKILEKQCSVFIIPSNKKNYETI